MTDYVTTATSTSNNGVVLSDALLTVHSSEVLYAAQPNTRFIQVASRKTELGVAPGLTIQFLKYSALTGDGILTENEDIATANLASSNVGITVSEHGKAVSMTELLLRSSFDDVMASATRVLGAHYAVTQDSDIRKALLAGTNVIYGGGKASRALVTANDKLTVSVIKNAVETLATNKAPKISLEGREPAYVHFGHPSQYRDLKDDSEWISAASYGDPARIFRGEIGRIDDVIFIETTQVPYIDTSGDVFVDGVDSGANLTQGSVDIYRGVLCADHCVGFAESLPVELRDNGVQDFNRKHELAWYSIYGVALIETGHSLIIETA